MNSMQLVLEFFISGAVVVGAVLLSKYVDPKWAGFLVALPIMTLLGFLFISTQQGPGDVQKYLLSAVLFMVPAAAYLLSAYFLYGRVSTLTTLVVPIIPLVILTIVMQKFL